MLVQSASHPLPHRKAPPGQPPVYEVVKTVPSDTWESTSLLRDRDEIFKQQTFHPRTQQQNPEVVRAFGSATPHSGDALLHYAGKTPDGVAKKQTPVLLVHGATKDGNFWWDPSEDGKNDGLAQKLRDSGHETFAVTFAHNQDDNFLWA